MLKQLKTVVVWERRSAGEQHLNILTPTNTITTAKQ